MLKQIKSLFFIESFVLYSNAELTFIITVALWLYFCVIVTNHVVIFVTVKELVNEVYYKFYKSIKKQRIF